MSTLVCRYDRSKRMSKIELFINKIKNGLSITIRLAGKRLRLNVWREKNVVKTENAEQKSVSVRFVKQSSQSNVS